MEKINKKTGLYCALAAFVVWLAIMVVIVSRLPVKADTLLMLSWPTLPGVIGGLVFYKMDKNNEWAEEKR